MESTKYSCEFCNQEFSRHYNLKRHLELVHNRFIEMETSDADEDDTTSMGSSTSSTTNTSDRESDKASEVSSSDMSTNSELSERECSPGSKHYVDLMVSIYNQVFNKMSVEPIDGEEKEADDKQIMTESKKQFRKRLINYLIICHELRKDQTYDYLFNKIDKYIGEEIEYPTAIRMAVKASAEIIDKDFEETVIDELKDEDTSEDEEAMDE